MCAGDCVGQDRQASHALEKWETGTLLQISGWVWLHPVCVCKKCAHATFCVHQLPWQGHMQARSETRSVNWNTKTCITFLLSTQSLGLLAVPYARAPSRPFRQLTSISSALLHPPAHLLLLLRSRLCAKAAIKCDLSGQRRSLCDSKRLCLSCCSVRVKGVNVCCACAMCHVP